MLDIASVGKLNFFTLYRPCACVSNGKLLTGIATKKFRPGKLLYFQSILQTKPGYEINTNEQSHL